MPSHTGRRVGGSPVLIPWMLFQRRSTDLWVVGAGSRAVGTRYASQAAHEFFTTSKPAGLLMKLGCFQSSESTRAISPTFE
jgi:hypothetical protein